MRVLSNIEVDVIISQGRMAPEQEIMALLDEFESNHPSVYRMIYGEPSDGIYLINEDMANLYLDLSCDVIWLFSKAFGNPSTIKNEEEWVLKQLSLIDAELKSLGNNTPMNSRFRENLQNRFVNRSIETKVQMELIKHLESEVSKYASFKKTRNKAIQITNNLLFVLVRLMGDLYSFTAENRA